MDDQPKKRAPSVMGDDARATVGRDHRLAVPEHVDPEATPPPQEMPRPDSLAGHNTLPPAIRERFDLMADSLGGLTAAVGKVWDARNVAPQLAAIETKVDAYTRDVIEGQTTLREFVLPAIKALMAKVDVIAAHHDRNTGRTEQFWSGDLPRMVLALEKLDSRLDDFAERISRLEHTVDKLHSSIAVAAARVTAVESVGNSLDVRVTALERRLADQDAGDKREQALAVRKRRIYAAVWGAVTAAGGALAGWLTGK